MGHYALLLKQQSLINRIDFYHQSNVLVSTGRYLTEYAIREQVFEKFMDSAKTIGFDIIEISENSIHLTFEEKKKILKIVDSYDMRAQWKIGTRKSQKATLS